MRNRRIAFIFFTFALMTLASCGGSSGSGNNPGGSSSTSSSSNSASSSGSPTAVAEETLPRIEINTLGNTIPDEPKVNATMTVTDYVIGELPITDFSGSIGIEMRGSSSQYYFDKKNYGIELRDSSGADMDASILGFPEEEDWVLHGPYSDKSLLRNTLMFDIGQEFGRYASRWKYLELYLNNQYMGVYVLLEKIKRDDNRVDISNLKEDDNEGEELSGGYIIKLDKTNGEHAGNPGAYDLYTDNMSFQSSHNTGFNTYRPHFIYHQPKPADISEQQKTYIQDYINAFEDSLASDSFADETLGYRNYINVDSFVDYFIATEISGNVDGYRLSTFLVKDKNEKLAMGPLWDYNLAFGNADYCNGWEYNLWVYLGEERCEGGAFPIPFWWARLLQDDYFVGLLKSRWTALRSTALSDAALEEKINSKANYLKATGAANRNFDRWDTLGMYIWPNYYVGFTYDEEVNTVKTWLNNRMSWLDNEIENL